MSPAERNSPVCACVAHRGAAWRGARCAAGPHRRTGGAARIVRGAGARRAVEMPAPRAAAGRVVGCLCRAAARCCCALAEGCYAKDDVFLPLKSHTGAALLLHSIRRRRAGRSSCGARSESAIRAPTAASFVPAGVRQRFGCAVALRARAAPGPAAPRPAIDPRCPKRTNPASPRPCAETSQQNAKAFCLLKSSWDEPSLSCPRLSVNAFAALRARAAHGPAAPREACRLRDGVSEPCDGRNSPREREREGERERERDRRTERVRVRVRVSE